jgi:hypothetical protein
VPLLTIVEDYIFAALRHARVENQEQGVLGAYVPQFPGLVAFGADQHDLALVLASRLQELVRIRLESGQHLPLIGGIDLNTEANKILATYHTHPAPDRPASLSADGFQHLLEHEDREAYPDLS